MGSADHLTGSSSPAQNKTASLALLFQTKSVQHMESHPSHGAAPSPAPLLGSQRFNLHWGLFKMDTGLGAAMAWMLFSTE